MKLEAFEPLGLKHLDALYGYALRLARKPEDAEDLVQETYARAIEHVARFSDPALIRPTLFRMLHNLYVDHWRADQRGPIMISAEVVSANPESAALLSDPDNPRDALLRDALSDEVERALSELDDEWRHTIWLREIEGFTYDEISEVTRVPVGTVRSRLARARRALAEKLESYARERGAIPKMRKEKGPQSL